ncbi:hydrogenase/urease maturation nickel metallochaperone HypA [Pseudonocardia sp. MH-G8]|uniref:Kae1-like domain-containing protein n=1 Tax=Pseudonocardia sp. MH-G8 TaxID=1854588 RepID=UPI00117A93D6|nr:hydrogenase/urease maturation nickel metallochaperone HypA [Pseudonocardia sp. MH-G8]
MHELAITQSVVETIVERTECARVTAVHLVIGKVSGVVPGAVRFCFEIVAAGSPVEGARGYRSRAWAERHADGRPLTTVQHHHAHVASVMAEHGLDGSRPVVGISFDGTGYGTDGAVWGGEVLAADYAGFHRFAHLRYVPLAGGDASVRRPYRMALAHLRAAGVDWDDDLPPVAACPPAELRVLAHQLATGTGCVPTSSMGRLFDAVSALLGIRQIVDFEAQAAIELECRSRNVPLGDRAYMFAVRDGGPNVPLVADPEPVIRAVVADLRAGVTPATAGARFHAAVVALVVALADRARRDLDLHDVALTGGVFQNALLLGVACRALRAAGFSVLRHQRVPPGDGGLALGQLLVAAGRKEMTLCRRHRRPSPVPVRRVQGHDPSVWVRRVGAHLASLPPAQTDGQERSSTLAWVEPTRVVPHLRAALLRYLG